MPRTAPIRTAPPLTAAIYLILRHFACPMIALGQRYVEISAEVESVTYLQSTNGAQNKRTYPVTCVVGKDKWSIEDEFPINATDYWYYDGTNVYQRSQITKDIQHNGNSLATVPFEQAKSNVTIAIIDSPGGHPLGDLGVNVPWLAFCSAPYLKQPSHQIPLPTSLARIDPYAFAYRDGTATFEDDLGLPKTVELFTSRAQYEKAPFDKRLIRTSRVQLARVHSSAELRQDGLLAFRYQAVAWTNVAGWTFPTEFKYATYRTDIAGATQTTFSGTGRVVHIREAAEPADIFAAPKGQPETIVDWRFRDEHRVVDAIIYQTTNLVGALPLSTPRLEAAFNEARRTAPLEIRYAQSGENKASP
jgi:hypothetical protein